MEKQIYFNSVRRGMTVVKDMSNFGGDKNATYEVESINSQKRTIKLVGMGFNFRPNKKDQFTITD